MYGIHRQCIEYTSCNAFEMHVRCVTLTFGCCSRGAIRAMIACAPLGGHHQRFHRGKHGGHTLAIIYVPIQLHPLCDKRLFLFGLRAVEPFFVELQVVVQEGLEYGTTIVVVPGNESVLQCIDMMRMCYKCIQVWDMVPIYYLHVVKRSASYFVLCTSSFDAVDEVVRGQIILVQALVRALFSGIIFTRKFLTQQLVPLWCPGLWEPEINAFGGAGFPLDAAAPLALICTCGMH